MNRFLPLFFFISLLSLFLFWLLIGGSNENHSPLIGKSLPDYEIEFMSESNNSLDDLMNRPGFKIINFWASWCLPCLVEHPILMALRGKENLTIIGINYKDNKEDASEFLREHGDPYDFIGIDKDGFFGIEMGITGVPETFVVDENGKVMIRHVGPIDFGNALVKP
jgi:cytochrome c biogenesis protein CcmG/thiol:disulfide interchange protein DsbE